jgi:tetratricopeptide (TPR) repeat protein
MSIVLALLIASTAAAPPDHAAVATAPQIEKLIRDGKADDAMEKGRAAVAARPEDVDLRLALARALAAKARRVTRLVNVKVEADETAPGKAKVADEGKGPHPAVVDYDSGLLEEALLHLGFGIDHAPRREDLRVFQCFLLTDAGRIDRAKAAIEGALKALPKSASLAKTMTAYGAERAKRGDAAGAAALLAPVADAFPSNAAILVDYGNVLTRLGRKPEAYAAFDRATTLAPQDVGYARTKAVGAMLLRDYGRARAAFDTVFQIGHGIADKLASYAAAYGVDPKGAAALMQGIIGSDDPDVDPTVTDLAVGFAQAGYHGPSSDEAMTLARTLVHSQQYVLAIPILDRALKDRADNADAKSMLQSVYRGLGCPSLAK